MMLKCSPAVPFSGHVGGRHLTLTVLCMRGFTTHSLVGRFIGFEGQLSCVIGRLTATAHV